MAMSVSGRVSSTYLLRVLTCSNGFGFKRVCGFRFKRFMRFIFIPTHQSPSHATMMGKSGSFKSKFPENPATKTWSKCWVQKKWAFWSPYLCGGCFRPFVCLPWGKFFSWARRIPRVIRVTLAAAEVTLLKHILIIFGLVGGFNPFERQ